MCGVKKLNWIQVNVGALHVKAYYSIPNLYKPKCLDNRKRNDVLGEYSSYLMSKHLWGISLVRNISHCRGDINKPPIETNRNGYNYLDCSFV